MTIANRIYFNTRAIRIYNILNQINSLCFAPKRSGLNTLGNPRTRIFNRDVFAINVNIINIHIIFITIGSETPVIDAYITELN